LNSESKNVEAVKGCIPTQRNCLISFNLLAKRAMQHSTERNNKKDQGSQNGLFSLLCKVGEALVLDLHDIQHAPNKQLAETHFIVKWSNIFKNVCEICCLL